MTNKGMVALLCSAILLESLCPQTATARRKNRPRADLPEVATDAATPKTPASEVGIRVTLESQGSATPAPPMPTSPPPVSRPVITPVTPPVITPVTPVPPPAQASGAPTGMPTASGTGQLTLPPGPPPTTEPPPSFATGNATSSWKKTLIGGLGVLGGSYALNLVLGGVSYGAFSEGQWGWFVPLAGPVVVMSGGCGNPNPCYFKSLFTYMAGAVTTLTYLGGITVAIVGLVGMRRGAGSANRVKLLPYAERDSGGLVLIGRF
jgi:hypothetical protein